MTLCLNIGSSGVTLIPCSHARTASMNHKRHLMRTARGKSGMYAGAKGFKSCGLSKREEGVFSLVTWALRASTINVPKSTPLSPLPVDSTTTLSDDMARAGSRDRHSLAPAAAGVAPAAAPHLPALCSTRLFLRMAVFPGVVKHSAPAKRRQRKSPTVGYTLLLSIIRAPTFSEMRPTGTSHRRKT